MATTAPAPPAPPAPAPDDLVTHEEIVALMAQTGHPVSRSTVRRWHLRTYRRGRYCLVSFSDALAAHRDMLAHRA